MGKGDKKSKRGKIFMGTFGVRRPHSVSKPVKAAASVPEPAEAVKEAPKKKAAASTKKK